MNKKEYLDSIRSKLTGLPEKDIDSAIEYYEEAIEDRIEDGLTEEQAINAVGTPEEIAEKILMDSSIPKLITAKAKPQYYHLLRLQSIQPNPDFPKIQ